MPVKSLVHLCVQKPLKELADRASKAGYANLSEPTGASAQLVNCNQRDMLLTFAHLLRQWNDWSSSRARIAKYLKN